MVLPDMASRYRLQNELHAKFTLTLIPCVSWKVFVNLSFLTLSLRGSKTSVDCEMAHFWTSKNEWWIRISPPFEQVRNESWIRGWHTFEPVRNEWWFRGWHTFEPVRNECWMRGWHTFEPKKSVDYGDGTLLNE